MRQGIALFRGFALIPIYIQILGSELYGLWVASGGVLTMLTFMDLGLSRMLIQKVAYYSAKNQKTKAFEYYLNGLVIYILLGLLVFLLGYVISSWLIEWISHDSVHQDIILSVFRTSLIYTGFTLLNDGIYGGFQALQKNKFALISSTIFSMIGLIATVFFVYNNFGLWSIVLGFIIQVGGTFFSYCIILFRIGQTASIEFCFRREIIKEYFKISPFLITARLSKAFTQNLEPTIVSFMLGPVLAGNFKITTRVADFSKQFLNITLGGLYAGLAHLIGENKKQRVFIIVNKLVSFFILFGAFAFGLYAILNYDFVSLWMSSRASLSREFICLMALAYFGKLSVHYLFNIDVAFGDFKKPSAYLFIESLCRLSLILIMIKVIGINGLPIAIIITTCISSLMYVVNINKKLLKSIVVEKRTVYGVCLIFVLTLISLIYLPQINADNWTTFVLTTACIGSIFILVLGIANRDLRQWLLDKVTSNMKI